jgi:hypothetical protein
MEVTEREPNEVEAHPFGVELILRRGMGRSAKPMEILGATLGLGEESLAQCKVIKLE